jgi:hypothetical protein
VTRPRPHSEDGVLALPEAGTEPMVPELRIRTLGTPQVWLGEVPLTFRRRKSLALLVYLALTRLAHGRDALASLFVDRASDAQARAQFRTTLKGPVEQVGDAPRRISRLAWPHSVGADASHRISTRTAASPGSLVRERMVTGQG